MRKTSQVAKSYASGLTGEATNAGFTECRAHISYVKAGEAPRDFTIEEFFRRAVGNFRRKLLEPIQDRPSGSRRGDFAESRSCQRNGSDFQSCEHPARVESRNNDEALSFKR